MLFIAEELREIMAKLGIRTVDELVGRTDLLLARKNRITDRADTVDLSSLISSCDPVHYNSGDKFDFKLESTLDEKPAAAELYPLLQKEKKPHSVSAEVSSTNRTFGTILGSVITKTFGTSLEKRYLYR